MSDAATDVRPTRSREDSTARTREAIVEAAATLFAERGYRAVSLREIAAAAGISHPGLLRHFSSGDDLLRAVVDRLDDANRRLPSSEATSLDAFVHVARRNAATPGYSSLLLGLVGLAVYPDHPEHAAVAARYGAARAQFADVFRLRASDLGGGLDPVAEGVRTAAAWDGLQLISLYLPEIQVPDALRRRLVSLGTGATADPMPPLPPSDPRTATSPRAPGYASGRARRAQILAAASDQFARSGYHGASLREIAAMVGTGASTLKHHFGDKERLLVAVLERQEQALAEGREGSSTLWTLPARVARNLEATAGLIQLQTTLCTEASVPSHPAHPYFAERYRTLIASFAEDVEHAQASGTVPPDRDPWFEALWVTGLLDGLHMQWFYAPDAVGPGALIAGHLERLRSSAATAGAAPR
ncbi:TetR/AcrR family transcriptional regulator [Cellulomonas hominis]|uniref:TetR/AcrR family transcriptional regulator n=1 Tax=Cellulomonas hominis TaxID=156981 RepID=UPI001BA07DE3|nr:TetR/AcrR family transcriptional regulator [Cellulomonas hominis]VTR75396.1 HTH-type transcriptional repressor KstR2 [Cellulomonas hominis]